MCFIKVEQADPGGSMGFAESPSSVKNNSARTNDGALRYEIARKYMETGPPRAMSNNPGSVLVKDHPSLEILDPTVL